MSSEGEVEICKCFLCKEEYEIPDHKPLLLPCGHAFCELCLLNQNDVHLTKGDRKQCAKCKKEWFGEVQKLTFVADLLKSSDSTEVDESPNNIVELKPPVPEHKGITVNRTCVNHPNVVVEYVCRNCLDVCCEECRLSGHQGCYCEPLGKRLQHLGQEYQQFLGRMQSKSKELCDEVDDVDEAIEYIEDFFISLNELKKDFERHKHQVQQSLSKVDNCIENASKNLTSTDEDDVDKLLTKMNITCQFNDVETPGVFPPHPICLVQTAAKNGGDMEYPYPKRYRWEFPKTLQEFGYEFKGGKLVKTDTGEPFNFNVKKRNHEYNQAHYEALGNVMTDEIYRLLETECGLHRMPVPTDDIAGGGKGFFFASKNWNTNERLMVLIHGSGAVRAGQWARRLIINDSLDSGTQIPFIKRALQDGYDVLVLNGNQTEAPNEKGVMAPVYLYDNQSGRSDPTKHGCYVWRNYVQMSAAKHIAIVAHSYGGVVTTHLYSKFTEDFNKKVFAVAFTDSVHSPPRGVDSRRFVEITRNWVASSQPLDTPERSMYGDVERVSSGAGKHEETSWSSFKSIFKFFNDRLEEKLQEPHIKPPTNEALQQNEGEAPRADIMNLPVSREQLQLSHAPDELKEALLDAANEEINEYVLDPQPAFKDNDVEMADLSEGTEYNSKATAKGDLKETTDDNSKETTDGDSKETTDGDSKTTTDGDSKATTDGDSKATTDGDSKATTDGDSKATTDGDSKTTTHGDSKATTDGDSKTTTHGDSKATTDGDSKTTTDGDSKATTDGDSKVTADGISKVTADGISKTIADGISKATTDSDSEATTDGDSKPVTDSDPKAVTDGDSSSISNDDLKDASVDAKVRLGELPDQEEVEAPLPSPSTEEEDFVKL